MLSKSRFVCIIHTSVQHFLFIAYLVQVSISGAQADIFEDPFRLAGHRLSIPVLFNSAVDNKNLVRVQSCMSVSVLLQFTSC
jgi:hypothetical protein